jgi:hypothetical protein
MIFNNNFNIGDYVYCYECERNLTTLSYNKKYLITKIGTLIINVINDLNEEDCYFYKIFISEKDYEILHRIDKLKIIFANDI